MVSCKIGFSFYTSLLHILCILLAIARLVYLNLRYSFYYCSIISRSEICDGSYPRLLQTGWAPFAFPKVASKPLTVWKPSRLCWAIGCCRLVRQIKTIDDRSASSRCWDACLKLQLFYGPRNVPRTTEDGKINQTHFLSWDKVVYLFYLSSSVCVTSGQLHASSRL